MTNPSPESPAPRKDPAHLLQQFLEKEGIVLMQQRPEITFTEDGGAIFKPRFAVAYKS